MSQFRCTRCQLFGRAIRLEGKPEARWDWLLTRASRDFEKRKLTANCRFCRGTMRKRLRVWSVLSTAERIKRREADRWRTRWTENRRLARLTPDEDAMAADFARLAEWAEGWR